MTDYSWWKDIRTGQDPRRNKNRGAFCGIDFSFFITQESKPALRCRV
jgi:hypothetical protein